jgi:carbonic anhydrase/acetyltransferase-like protein (isoleucine patch superfamily)
MNRIPFRDFTPDVDPSVYIADGVQLIGDVKIDKHSSIWFNAVVRADLAEIRIGARTNLQDGVIAHLNTGQPLIIGNDVSIGHGAIVHGCIIADGALIGMGAIVLNGAEIGEYALVGAGALVAENQKIPPYSLAVGSPARVVRKLTEQDLHRMAVTSNNYISAAQEYMSLQNKRVSDEV